MITLPAHPRRALLTSFWIVLSAAAGLLVAAGLCRFAARNSLIVGVGAACAIGLAGRVWPRLASIAYRAWNRASRFVARSGRLALLWICYFVVLLAVGKKGGRFDAGEAMRPGSRWVDRRTLAPDAYPIQFNAPTDGTTADGWIRGYIHWAVKSKNLWAVALLPFLTLIAMLEEHEQPVLPATIYTLF
jgi:hypothetical protein